MITLKHLLEKIEVRQPVLNKNELLTVADDMVLEGVGNLQTAQQGQLSFLANARYRQALEHTKASVVVVDEKHVNFVPKDSVAVVVSSPYLAYASVSQLFDISKHHDNQASKIKIHPTAQISDTAMIDENVQIGAFCVVGAGVKIGTGTVLASHVAVGDGVSIGKRCHILSQVVIAHDCVLGDDVRVHAHASIGSEGFGFAPVVGSCSFGWERIAQLGRVVIGNRVRIGSQTCIDRGAIDDTVIGDDVIIDNLVQVAHNVKIGAGTAIAAKTGIAGSVIIGKRCIIGGAVGISGHLQIADEVTITAMSMVTKSIQKSGSYSSGTTAMPTVDWRRAVVHFRQSGRKSGKSDKKCE